MVASSDLTHYEPDAAARSKDMEVIAAILDMDVGLFYRILYDRRVSACGYGAIAAIMGVLPGDGAPRGDGFSSTPPAATQEATTPRWWATARYPSRDEGQGDGQPGDMVAALPAGTHF